MERCEREGDEEKTEVGTYDKVREILAGDGSGERWMREIEKRKEVKREKRRDTESKEGEGKRNEN